MSVTPARLSITTSFAFISRQSWPARCTLCAPSRAVTDGRDVAMRFGKGFNRGVERRILVCSLSVMRKFRESLFRISHAKWYNKKDLATPVNKDSQVVSFPPPRLLLDDPDLDLRVDIRVQPNGDSINAEGANRLMQVDLTLLDLEPLGLQLVRNVRGRHRSEKLAFLP